MRKCHATFTIVEYLSEALYLLQDLVTCIFFPFALKAYFILETQIIDFYHKIGGYQVMIKCLSSEHRYTCLVKKALKLQIVRLIKVAYML